MARPVDLKVRILSDSSQAQADFGRAGGKAAKFGTALKVAGGTALVAGGAVKVAYDKMIKPAGDLEQSIGAIDTVFKGNAKQMHSWAKGAATSVGLTRNEYNELGTLIGTQLRNGGTAMDKLAPKTDNLIGLGADLSSMFGGTTKEAVEALSSALKGERDPIEKYGVSLKQSSIDAEAARLGYKKVGGALSDQAQQAATLSLISKQTKDAQGNFAKESETLAGKQQRLTAQYENAKATLGTALLPVATKVFGFLADTALPAITKLIDGFSGFGKAGDGIGDLGAKLGLDKLGPMFTNLTTVWKTVTDTAVPVLVNAFKTIGPPLLEVGKAVVGLVTVVSARLVPVIKFLAPFIQQAFTNVLNILKPVLSFIAALIRTVTAVIKGDWSGAWNGIKDMFAAVWQLIKNIVTNAINTVKLVLSTAWPAIKAVASAAWNGIKALIGKAWDGIKNDVTAKVGLIKTGLTTAWNAIKGAASAAWTWVKNKVVGLVTSLQTTVQNRVDQLRGAILQKWNQIKNNALTAWNNVKSTITGAVDKMKTEVERRVDNVRRNFTELPGKIKAALTGAPKMLLQAGKDIVGGLINGIKSKIGDVETYFKNLTDKIPDWKGPLPKDKRLLEPAGAAIMGGLIRSIDNRRRDLRSTLQDVTTDVSRTTIPAPSLGAVAGTRSGSSTRSSSTAGGTVVNITVNGALDPLAVAGQIESMLARRRVVMGTA